MDLGLQGRAALVTGGSKGIGLAVARALRAEGARVVIASRGAGNIAAACQALPGLEGVAADFSDAGAALGAIDEAERRWGPLDILVNCAGAAKRTPADELTPADWRAAMDAKFFPYIHACDPLAKRMAARGRGVIVNVIGMGGKVASPTHLPGGAANAALMLATAGLAHAYASRGVRVVGVNPGLTETERLTAGLTATARQLGVDLDEARRRGGGDPDGADRPAGGDRRGRRLPVLGPRVLCDGGDGRHGRRPLSGALIAELPRFYLRVIWVEQAGIILSA